MIRVLHLLKTEADSQSLHGFRAMRQTRVADIACSSRRIGRGGDFRHALHAAAWLRFARNDFDLIHAWDSVALAAAVPARLPVIFSPSAPGISDPWVRKLAGSSGRIRVVPSSRTAAELHRRAGIPEVRRGVIRPPIDVGLLPAGRDEALRESLGIAPTDRVLLAPGESTVVARHRLAVHAASILHVLDARYRLLLPGRGREILSLRRLEIGLNQPRGWIFADEVLRETIEPTRLLGAADLALITARGLSGGFEAALCQAAGLPIAAVDTPILRELLDGTTARFIAGPDPRELARAALEMLELPASARIPSVPEAFSPERFARAYHELYRRAADESAGVSSAVQRA